MLNISELPYDEIWCWDYEYICRPGGLFQPVCMVASEIKSGRKIEVWEDEFPLYTSLPFPSGEGSLVISYYSSSELGCNLALGWEFPVNLVDLYAEFRCITNGSQLVSGKGLIGAMARFGLDCIGVTEKDEMRDLILKGGTRTRSEKDLILKYCHSDVEALRRLFPVMCPLMDLKYALLRGRYMKSVARMERIGIPVDIAVLGLMNRYWVKIQDSLIRSIDSDFGVFEGQTFKYDRWEKYLSHRQIVWPRLESGKLDLKDDTFGDMSLLYPEIAPMKDLRGCLSKMKLSKLTVGEDGRNRCLLSPFASTTGRNQPSSSRSVFGPSKWMRGLIKPPEGKGIAYIDWCQQEFGISAALSRDPLMMEAYHSVDPYLEFAKQARAVPADATKTSHPVERHRFKTCALAVLYGMGAGTLSSRADCSLSEARDLLRLHHQMYPFFWSWSDSVVDYATIYRSLWTTFGWRVHYPDVMNPRSARNFPVQGNGAEMMRLAACLSTERGIKVCTPVHDAFLIEFDLYEEEESVLEMEECMKEASALVLDGFELRTDVTIVRYPDRYMDERGEVMWNLVQSILDEIQDRD